MKLINKAGFTIIEVMLFLSITGLLAVGILAGASSSINIQRYRDSVTSLQAIIQQQYSEVINVSNDRVTTTFCNNDSDVLKFETKTSSINRGQSDCQMLGKLITVLDNKQLAINTIVGARKTTTPKQSSDIKELEQYSFGSLPGGSSTYKVEWGSRLVNSENSLNFQFSIFIVRSPISGVVNTFINPTVNLFGSQINNAINSDAVDPNKSSLKICVDSGGLFAGTKSAVLVKAGSTSAAGVEILGDATSGCL